MSTVGMQTWGIWSGDVGIGASAELAQQEKSEEHDALEVEDGIVRIEDEDLDHTDRENLKFVYPL